MSEHRRGIDREPGSTLVQPPQGWRACQRCGLRLAPLPLTVCRRCYGLPNGTKETWDRAAARQNQAWVK